MMLTEKGFGLNDFFVIGAVLVSWTIYFLLPKIFSEQVTVLIFLYSVTAAGILDNSFGAAPFDFYDIMDGPAYTVMDVVVYFLYPPFGYIFLFIYQKLHISNRFLVLFILVFSVISFGFEWVNFKMGVFHYKSGYSIIYSVCVYLIVQPIFVLFFNLIKENPLQTKKPEG
jgi:hypothetical protein